jgi:photosystem II stability/assembly factor-like uncharacterized protein
MAYEVILAIFAGPASEPLRKIEAGLEQMESAIGEDKTIADHVMQEIEENASLKDLWDDEEWLHGMDVVNPAIISEIPRQTDLSAIDDLEVHLPAMLWIAGWDGLILHSRDDGAHWAVQPSRTRSNLAAVDFVDTNHGWAVGDKGVILKTTTGGRDWSQVYQSADHDHFAIDCIDQDRCWVAGYYPFILRTGNGGLDWQQSPDLMTGGVRNRAILMLSPSEGLAAGNAGVWRTRDGGQTWKLAFQPGEGGSVPPSTAYNGLHSPDGTTVWAVGTYEGGTEIIRSGDAGQTWTRQSGAVRWPDGMGPQGINANAVHAVTDMRATIAANNGVVLATVDGGLNWWPQMAFGSSTYSLYALAMRDERTGWAAGNLGQVFATTSGGKSWIPVRGPYFETLRYAGELAGVDIDPE